MKERIAYMVAGALCVGIGMLFAPLSLVSQPSSPGAVNGCVVNANPTSATTNQSIPFTCDLAGRLRVNSNN